MKLLLASLLLAPVCAWTAEPLTFNEDIRPILSDNCFACHGTDAKHRKADLRLDTSEGARKPNEDGVAAIVPGDPAKSDAWVRIASDDPDEVMPPPKNMKQPVTYEVVWAEDGDLPTPENFNAPPPAGEWRAGDGVPLIGGTRALRMEGAGERAVMFSFGDALLTASAALRAFAHVQLDAANPPRALSIEFISAEKVKGVIVAEKIRRLVWGDAKAFGDAAKDAVVVGPLPLPGAYVLLEADAKAAGLKEGDAYLGVRLALSDGAAWWDRIGTVSTSRPDADPPLSSDAWRKSVRDKIGIEKAALTIDGKFLSQVQSGDPTPDEKQRGEDFFRRYIYGPTRGALENEAHAARRLLAEQVALERQLPGSLIARELPVPRPAFILLRGQYNNHGEAVEPGTPAFLPPLKHDGRATRLDLARWLVARENPLTARVAVNRVWQQFFGAGLVRTPGDFTAREPNDAERKLLTDALATQRAHFSTDPEAAKKVLANGESKPAHDLPPEEFAAWTLVANLLFNLDETITRN